MSVIRLRFKLIALKYRVIHSKKKYFSYVFNSFLPFYAKRENCSRRASLGHSFLKIDRIDLLLSLQTSDGSELIPSIFKKEQRERFALFHERIALLLFRSQNLSYLLEKPMIKFPTLDLSDQIVLWL